MTDHPCCIPMSVSAGVSGSVTKCAFAVPVTFLQEEAKIVKRLGFFLLFSSCCPTQLISIMTALYLCSFWHCQTINEMTFKQRVEMSKEHKTSHGSKLAK